MTMKSMESYEALKKSIERVEHARACIRQNARGPNRDEAREAYVHVVQEELTPAMVRVLDDALDDFAPRDVERLGQFLLTLMRKVFEPEEGAS